MKQLLVVVDYQNDFVSGALGFEGAQTLEAPIMQAIENTLANGGYVLFTRDTHQANYLETREGTHIPVPHCIEGEHGHKLFGRLQQYEQNTPPNCAFIDKPTFGSADIAQAAYQLCGGAPDSISMCGVVTDICVITNTLLLHSAFTDARIQLLASACGSGNSENAAKALDVLSNMGIAAV